MSCRRAFEVDLPAFVARGRAPEFREFREHYPLCRDCAAEVRAWTELDLQLRGPDAHPAPELLLRYEAGGPEPGGDRRDLVSAHLEACASCREELRALRAFDRAGAVAPAAPAPSPLARAVAGVRWLAWQPAFAYALVLLLVIPVVVARWPAGAPPALKQEPERRLVDEQEGRLAQAYAERAQGRPATVYEEAKRAPAPDKPAPSEGGAAGGARAPAAPSRASPVPAEPVPAPPERARARDEPAPAPALELARKRAVAESAEAPDPSGESEPFAALLHPSRALDRALAAVEVTRVGESVRFEVPVAGLEAAGTLEVRVLHPDGRRELRETQRVESVQQRVRVDLPAVWATPGSYRVEVRGAGGGAAPERVLELRALVAPRTQ